MCFYLRCISIALVNQFYTVVSPCMRLCLRQPWISGLNVHVAIQNANAKATQAQNRNPIFSPHYAALSTLTALTDGGLRGLPRHTPLTEATSINQPQVPDSHSNTCSYPQINRIPQAPPMHPLPVSIAGNQPRPPPRSRDSSGWSGRVLWIPRPPSLPRHGAGNRS